MPPTYVVEVVHRFVVDLDDETRRRLVRIEAMLHTVITKENKISMDIHEEIAEAFGPVLDAVSQVSTDTAQALADLAAQLAPKLSDDEKARFADVAGQLLALDATVKAADPGDGSTPPAEPTPGDGDTTQAA